MPVKPVFHTFEDAVSCRLCGATHAKPHENKWKVCANCFGAFHYREGGDLSDDAFTAFIASRLVNDAKRAGREEYFGRCEVISSTYYGFRGYQCGHIAMTMRDGHKVCASHSKATKPTYIGEATMDEYDAFTEQLRYVCERDKRFEKAVRDALT